MTPFDRRTTGKPGIRYPHIQMTDVFIDFFLNYRLNRNRAQQLFFAALHQRCTALHKSSPVKIFCDHGVITNHARDHGCDHSFHHDHGYEKA